MAVSAIAYVVVSPLAANPFHWPNGIDASRLTRFESVAFTAQCLWLCAGRDSYISLNAALEVYLWRKRRKCRHLKSRAHCEAGKNWIKSARCLAIDVIKAVNSSGLMRFGVGFRWFCTSVGSRSKGWTDATPAFPVLRGGRLPLKLWIDAHLHVSIWPCWDQSPAEVFHFTLFACQYANCTCIG